MEKMRIAQVSDLHISFSAQEEVYGVDTKSNFIKVLEDIKTKNIHHLVLSGDLCFRDTHYDIYKWIKEQLDIYKFTYDIIPGNHDDNKMIRDVFGQYSLGEKDIYFTKNFLNMQVFFLDTSTGYLSKDLIKYMDSILMVNKKIIIFMHHPPCLANVVRMDRKYPLENIEEVQEVFSKYQCRVYIFCGHYHTEKTIILNNQFIFLTPSTFCQINPDSDEFSVVVTGPAWRSIELYDDNIKTAVYYC